MRIADFRAAACWSGRRVAWRALVLTLLLAAHAAAQDTKATSGGVDVASLAGTWTVAANGDCSRSLYTWTVQGTEFQFIGPGGAVDVERVVAIRPDGFTAVTISSPSNPPGTRWDFRVVAPGLLHIRNLSTNRGFDLRRCDGAPARAVPAPSREEGRASWTFNPGDDGGGRIVHGVPETDNVSIQISCSADRRTMSATVSSPELPIGRRVRVAVAAGGTTTSFEAVYEEGMGGYVYATLPVSHPIVAMLRSGERSLRVQVAGIGYAIPLAGAAEHARRFEAACRG